MALIKCPECGTDVSDQAEACPKCAYPLHSHYQQQVVQPIAPVLVAKEGCFLQTMNTGCMLIFGFIALVIVFAMFGKACNP